MSNNNPSIQCSVCGRWKRLHGKDENGQAVQRFYGSGQNEDGTVHDHPKEVCDECCPSKCPYKKDPFAGIVKIQYEWWAGAGHGLRVKDRTTWTAIKDGNVIDYHSKDKLVEMCKREGLKYAVLRHSRKGNKVTIIEKNF